MTTEERLQKLEKEVGELKKSAQQYKESVDSFGLTAHELKEVLADMRAWGQYEED